MPRSNKPKEPVNTEVLTPPEGGNGQPPVEVAEDVKEKVEMNLSPVYNKFLESVSSGEREVYEKEPAKAMQSFRVYLNNLSDQEFIAQVVQA